MLRFRLEFRVQSVGQGRDRGIPIFADEGTDVVAIWEHMILTDCQSRRCTEIGKSFFKGHETGATTPVIRIVIVTLNAAPNRSMTSIANRLLGAP